MLSIMIILMAIFTLKSIRRYYYEDYFVPNQERFKIFLGSTFSRLNEILLSEKNTGLRDEIVTIQSKVEEEVDVIIDFNNSCKWIRRFDRGLLTLWIVLVLFNIILLCRAGGFIA